MSALSLTAYATNDNNSGYSRSFSDVPYGHWAYEQIMWMLDKKIIDGVGNNMFNPSGTVTRAQFAKMMVLTLNISLSSPSTPSFLDVKKNAWEYQYVESAKTYLTGFRSSAGDSFKPSLSAVREDMAVALVKAMGYQNESTDESILNRFADKSQISPNLRKYVALSVKHGLIEGKTENGRSVFSPQGNLTRAEASMLLYRAFKSNEDKITYDDEDKVTYDDNSHVTPEITVSSDSSGLNVKWNKITSSKLLGYAVVISMNDSTPKYPDNGYLRYITDRSQTSVTINNSTQYNGTSDFGRYLENGRKYYISVTAVYNDKSITGNTVKKTYNGPESPDSYTAPSAYTNVENGNIVVRWNKISSSNLKAYAVVISKKDSTPKYPDNGYLYYIGDRNTDYAVLNNKDRYNSGDFGGYMTKGEEYYVSVTAVYNDKNVTGNTIRFRYDGNENPELYVTPSARITTENGRLVLRWNSIDSSNLLGYRVVAAKNDSTPSYPDDGYLYWFTDSSRDYAVIDNSTSYSGGDFGRYFTKGERYYISVTAVYRDKNITGNSIRFRYDGTENPDIYLAPVVSSSMENGRLILRWDRIESANLQGYRVVASKSDSTPGYPDDGFLYWITDKSRNYAVIDNTTAYTDGDIGKYFIKGETYYFTVTAVYSDKNLTGNVVTRKYEGQDSAELFPAPTVTTEYNDSGVLVIKWNKIESSYLSEYRVVISKNSQTPSYPANGSYGAYDSNTTSASLSTDVEYTNGDFKKLTDSEKYYFSVTAVYSNGKYVAGNAVERVFLLPPK